MVDPASFVSFHVSDVTFFGHWLTESGRLRYLGVRVSPPPRPPPGTKANSLLLLPMPLGLLVQVIVIAVQDHLACESARKLGRTPFSS